LLYDGVRVVARLLGKARQGLRNLLIPYTDHTRKAKRRMLGMQNDGRKRKYQELRKMICKAVDYAEILLYELMNSGSVLSSAPGRVFWP
jgi:hypothetical protein